MAFSFRTALVAGLGAALVAGAAPGGAQTLQTVHVAGIPVELAGSLYYGVDKGFFKAQGLDVQIVTLSSTAATTQAVAAGAVDVGTTNMVSIAVAHERNVPIVVVAPAGASVTSRSLEGLIVAKDSPIQSAKDLNGKTLITSVLHNNLVIETNAWMEKHGGDYTSIKWTEAPNPVTGAMVATAKVDAAALGEPFLSKAIAAGDVRLITYLGREIAPEIVEGAYISSSDFAAKNGDLLKRFAAGLYEAGKWANRHKPEAAAILQKYSNSTQPPLPGAHHAEFLEHPFHADDIQPIIDAAAKYGVLKAPFPAADLVLPDAR